MQLVLVSYIEETRFSLEKTRDAVGVLHRCSWCPTFRVRPTKRCMTPTTLVPQLLLCITGTGHTYKTLMNNEAKLMKI
jgi:hypothetical protein